MRAGEFTARDTSTTPTIQVSDVAVDSHIHPTVLRVFLAKAKTDPFGKGVNIWLGRTGCAICPVVAILNYIRVRPQGQGPLLVLQDGSSFTKGWFIKRVREALRLAGIDPRAYAGHSFRIGAATTAVAAGVPAYTIKMMGRWSSEAYTLYIREPACALAAVSHKLVSRANTAAR